MNEKFTFLKDKMALDLRENVLPFWLTAGRDEINGGFVGEISREGVKNYGADRLLVLSARILWAFSSAYRIFGNEEYLLAAQEQYAYMNDHFIDKVNGGAYWLVGADGTVKDTVKRTYGEGFMLYAFSEFARATGRADALASADAMFDVIEHKIKRSGAYPSPYTEDWSPCGRDQIIENGYALSMNTHLHIIEPLTAYFRVNHSEEAEEALVNMIEIMTEKVLDKSCWHFHMFFDENWIPVTEDVSYGHDIEGSWLLCEAAEVLSEYASNKDRAAILSARCRDYALKMAEVVLAEGVDVDGGLFDEGDKAGNITSPGKVWWSQAEQVVGFVNAWQLCGDERYLDAAIHAWQYIDKNIIDHEKGEWFSYGNKPSDDGVNRFKVNGWKCPYHNGRCECEIYERWLNKV